MALCDENDINVFLSPNGIQVNSGDDVDEKNDAERIIRAYLAGRIDAVTMAGWTTPSGTPAIVRAIAGRLVAALRYKKMYAENSIDPTSTWGQELYVEAMSLLTGIVNGTVEIVDLPPGGTNTPEQALTRGNFYPNDDTATLYPAEAPQFTWQKSF